MLVPEKRAYIQFCEPIVEGSVRALTQCVHDELRSGTTHFTLLVSSPGGNIFWGLTAYDFLRGLPVRVDTHNIGSIDSVAIVIHWAGGRRSSVPHGRLMMHGVLIDVPSGTRFEEKTLNESIKSLKMDTENIAGVVAEHPGKTAREIKAMYEGAVLNPEQAVGFGLVHEIRAELFPSDARVCTLRMARESSRSAPVNPPQYS